MKDALYPPITLGEWEIKKKELEKQEKEMEPLNRLPILMLKAMHRRRKKYKNPYINLFKKKVWALSSV